MTKIYVMLVAVLCVVIFYVNYKPENPVYKSFVIFEHNVKYKYVIDNDVLNNRCQAVVKRYIIRGIPTKLFSCRGD